MAASSLLALLDDITSVLDDVAVLTKASAQKTAGVLGDDLAVNAEQVSGIRADRELKVVATVALGSARNKVILVPLALALSAWAHALIHPLLMLGGAFLCFEGAEKLLHAKAQPADETAPAEDAPGVDEAAKVRGAVRTDFVLSAEIVAITLGEVAGRPLSTQALVLTAISLLMTVGVYGFVAAIVKLDDVGLYLARTPDGWRPKVGRVILRAAPWLMRVLSVAGTVAMFLVGGGILVHSLPRVEAAVQGNMPLGLVAHGVVGVLAGLCIAALVASLRRLRKSRVAA